MTSISLIDSSDRIVTAEEVAADARYRARLLHLLTLGLHPKHEREREAEAG